MNMLTQVIDAMKATCQPPYSAARFLNRISFNDHLAYISIFGPGSYKSYCNAVAELLNTQHKQNSPKGILKKLYEIHCPYDSLNQISKETTAWLSHLFAINEIDPKQFFADFVCDRV